MTEGLAAPDPFEASQPPALSGVRGVVTLVEGTTFCISEATGDIVGNGLQGLYFRDARVLSRWQLRLDGQAPQPLSVVDSDAFTARFIGRRPAVPGKHDSTMLVDRHRWLGRGMREVITLSNVAREATAVSVELLVDTDFADLFAVKEGRPGAPSPRTSRSGMELFFSREDGSRGLLVHAAGEPTVSAAGLVWQVVIPPRESWTVELIAQPVVANCRIEPRFRDLPAEKGEPGWRDRVTELRVEHPGLARILQRTVHDLEALRMIDQDEPQRIYVAAGAPWFMTLFGRDSLLTSWMTLPLDPTLAVGTLQTLAALQGTQHDLRTEEQPGRILHEMRLGPQNVETLGGMNYYGTVDATPLFVALLGEVWRWGAAESTVRALLPAADAALSWMERHGDRDGDGFLEYQRATDRGLDNQGWKDSWDGINDATGRLAEPPIALAEAQGYAYAAWLARAELAEAVGERATASACRAKAEKLQQLFAERFWLPEEGFYAIALDGLKRPVDSITSNPAHCLWSGIVPDEHAERIVAGLAGLDSGFGLRTLSDRMGAYNPMSYHNGSIWPHDTAIAVAGLMRYAHIPGAVPLAHRLADGLIRAGQAFGGRLPELFCGFSADAFSPPIPYPTSCSPQAWASAAPLLLVRSFLGLEPDVPNRRLRLAPALPPSWGRISLRRLRLGDYDLRVGASTSGAHITGLPPEWTVALS
ncbi:glycogen debranching enzyme [Hamadaea flava]|uniref:Glycogen debranching N-terminal domain-containing protein n=1 Tax=Hamadaea flava TaxID=1742688 RepID=A0ABV8LR31_9ACTN|nr:glycogen debranching N-terminal domain-containing protein [Hamadaea flava]MCP2327262.1 glycogen debranching enzyme [Hamadaea flava]